MPESSGPLGLAGLLVPITSACLAIWAAAGKLLSRSLSRQRHRLWFDRSIGGLLALSAMGIVADALT